MILHIREEIQLRKPVLKTCTNSMNFSFLVSKFLELVDVPANRYGNDAVYRIRCVPNETEEETCEIVII